MTSKANDTIEKVHCHIPDPANILEVQNLSKYFDIKQAFSNHCP